MYGFFGVFVKMDVKAKKKVVQPRTVKIYTNITIIKSQNKMYKKLFDCYTSSEMI